MQVVHAHAALTTSEMVEESLTTIVARSVLEAALKEEESGELWFDLANEDGEEIESLFADSDVEAHGLKIAIAIAVTGAAILAPAGQAAVSQSVDAAATAQRANPAVSAQIAPAATTQVSSAAARTQVSSLRARAQVSKPLVLKASGLTLLRSGFVR